MTSLKKMSPSVADIPHEAMQLVSMVRSNGTVEVALVIVPVPEPGEDEVLIRVEATPINPSDVANMFGPADLSTIVQSSTSDLPVVVATLPEVALPLMANRIDQSVPVGNEGAGTVVKAGSSAHAQSLLGKTVAVFPTGMYAQYRCVKADSCLVLPDGISAEAAASCFVNPLTALGMVETMKREGHQALVHSAAASNLGKMLLKICLKDGIGLVNIVRNDAQVATLHALGATHVCNTSSPTFKEELTMALVATGATLGFDATGGGQLANTMLSCMEDAIGRRNQMAYGRYGSSVRKQVYLYGNLDNRPTMLARAYGHAWSVSGWLLMPYLAQIGEEQAQRLRNRVAAEIHSTFASHYSERVSLAGMLQANAIAAYSRRTTGTKFLVCPQLR
uniref:zinc-binding dehydrogenase n=1 Tax=Cupriavidus necator TaxID=106590 RepID=UPI003F491B6A